MSRSSSPNPGPATSVPAVRLDLTEATGRLRASAVERLLDLLARGIARACQREAHRTQGHARAGEVRVRIVDDAEMSRLHEEYSGISGTTDVLTFDMSGEADDRGVALLDVDIAVCLDEAERQGAKRGHAPEDEVLLYALHGVLHCLGHDDHDDDAFRAMHAAEDEILAAIGASVRFHAPEAGSKGGA
ncbi:MAG: rRNA maturation RNase YbeY [Phycisphaerales bacterium]|nr:rRNA maturation RNase YbeY [Phycisphaerales bacterium]